MRLRKTLFCLLLAFASCALINTGAVAQAAPNLAKDKAIRRLLELTGTVRQAQQVIDRMIDTMQQGTPSVPAEFWPELRKKIKPEELVAKIIPVYSKCYTKADIDGLIAFYESPLGRKVTASLPEITKESMTIGQEWGREKAEEVMHELQKRQNGTKEQTGRKGAPKPQARVNTSNGAAFAAIRIFGVWPIIGG